MDYILSVFITIITVVDPFGLIPIYLSLAGKYSQKKQKYIIFKAFFIAIFIATLFLFFGKYFLYYLGIGFNSIYITGGVLLFMIGLDMIYAKPRRTKGSPEENEEALGYDDISVFPLAIPMLAGPGTIATIILFSSKENSIENYLLVFSAMLLALLLSAMTMYFSSYILKLLGKTGLNVIDRLMGMILCSLAIQFIIDAFKNLGVI